MLLDLIFRDRMELCEDCWGVIIGQSSEVSRILVCVSKTFRTLAIKYFTTKIAKVRNVFDPDHACLRKIIRILVYTNDIPGLDLIFKRLGNLNGYFPGVYNTKSTTISDNYCYLEKHPRKFGGLQTYTSYLLSIAIREGITPVVKHFAGCLPFIDNMEQFYGIGLHEAVHKNYDSVVEIVGVLLTQMNSELVHLLLINACHNGNYKIIEMLMKNNMIRCDEDMSGDLISGTVSCFVPFGSIIPYSRYYKGDFCGKHKKQPQNMVKILDLLLDPMRLKYTETMSNNRIHRFPRTWYGSNDSGVPVFKKLMELHIKNFGKFVCQDALFYRAIKENNSTTNGIFAYLLHVKDTCPEFACCITECDLMLTAILNNNAECVRVLLNYVQLTLCNNLFLRFALLEAKNSDISTLLLSNKSILKSFDSDGKFVCDRGTITLLNDKYRLISASLLPTEVAIAVNYEEFVYDSRVQMLVLLGEPNRIISAHYTGSPKTVYKVSLPAFDFSHSTLEFTATNESGDSEGVGQKMGRSTHLVVTNEALVHFNRSYQISAKRFTKLILNGKSITQYTNNLTSGHWQNERTRKQDRIDVRRGWAEKKRLLDHKMKTTIQKHQKCQKLPKQKWGPTKQRSNRN